jgi:hypothetical protein
MTCPRCAAEANDGTVSCPSCGIIFAKWKETGAPLSPATRRASPWIKREGKPKPEPEYLGITHRGWKATAIGLGLAGLLTFFPFVTFILSPLVTLSHELGHTVVLWLFGFPAIPAFDFANGGGVTMSDLERAPQIVWAWGIGVLILGWKQRERKGVLALLAVAAVIYIWMYNSTRETLAITLGGHGGEVALGSLFLYRALTGWGCKLELERPLYAFVGFMVLFAGVKLGISLLGPTLERIWYLEGKAGIDNDLVTGAQILMWRLEGIARTLIAIELLAIPAMFMAASMRKTIGAVAEAEEEI